MSYHLIKGITHERWLEERSKGIGSSEVGTILGVNKYDNAYALWLRKTGQAPPVPENEKMLMGHVMEEAVATKFAIDTGATIKKGTQGDWLAVDDEKPFLRVSPDRLYWENGSPHSPRNYRIVECKNTDLDIDPDDPPMSWRMQLQYQMGVMGIKAGSIAWLCHSFGQRSGHARFESDRAFYLNEMVPRLEYFWKENIVRGLEPTPRTVDELRLAFPKAKEESTIVAPEEIISGIADYEALLSKEKEYKRLLKDIESRQDEFKNNIRTVMKDNETLLLPDGRVLATWKNAKDSEQFDLVKFREENEMIYRQYAYTETGSRRLSILKFRK